MATTASPPRRTAPSSASSASSPPRTSISKGATARSAVSSPRVASSLNGPTRRPSLKGATPSAAATGETRETLSASLKRETEEKEQLLVQTQNKDQTIANLTTDNDNLTSALSAAESRLNELYADQARMEEEMAGRLEVVDKLRTQVRELEREKRDIQRRYNEQTSTFDAERQAFYDNEQHLKSRIQSLMQARKHAVPSSPTTTTDPEPETEDEEEEEKTSAPEPLLQDMNDEESEPAEMTALRLELSTLSTSHASLQSTLILLQTQLIDLKRVNNELQEENESYNILLTEKTLSGQYDILHQVAGASSSDDGEDADEGRSMRSSARSTLDRVDEQGEEVEDEMDLERELGQTQDREEDERQTDSPSSHRPRRNGRSRTTNSPAPRGESLADLPITGPGLDLAAELGRAENKDILEGRAVIDDRDRSVLNSKGKRGKKSSTDSAIGRKVSEVVEPGTVGHDSMEALRSEVKSLKDANKALSLYASKIIDRIISQEGFEHVLSVDYEKLPPTPALGSAFKTTFSSPPQPSPKKARPQSAFFGRSTSSTTGYDGPEKLTTFNTPPLSPAVGSTTKHQRRSMSFDWKSFSIFNNGEKKPENPNLRPLTLRPGASPVVGARKLETQEDDDDRRERERLNATMKLMGIEKPPSPPMLAAPLMQKSQSTPGVSTESLEPSSPRPQNTSRFSFFRTKSVSDSGSIHSTSSAPNPSNLTQEALEEAEAETRLAALDAREKVLSAEIASGAPSGFTEITRRGALGEEWRSRRSKRSGGSGSTVWSAGMSKEDAEE